MPWVNPELQEGAVLRGWGCCVSEPRKPSDSLEEYSLRIGFCCDWGYVSGVAAPCDVSGELGRSDRAQ